jgi:hypothetical protein
MNQLAPDDPTYIKGRERFRQDMRLFRSRQKLWRRKRAMA